MNNISSIDYEFDILENINKSHKAIKQRDISKKIGISLGMTNIILKRLVKKGLLQTKKINNRNIKYLVSSKGLEFIAKRSYLYFKKTVKSIINYKEAILSLLSIIKEKGYKGVSLIGNSCIDFLIEFACYKYDIVLVKHQVDDFYIIFSEEYFSEEKNIDSLNKNNAFLRKILLEN